MPWFHLCTLLDKLGTRAEREWYLAKAVEHGWSRSVLVMQIETQTRERSLPSIEQLERELEERPAIRHTARDGSRGRTPGSRAGTPTRKGRKA